MAIDWKALLKMTAPVVGTLASGGPSHGAFLSGYTRGSQLAQQARERKAAEAAKKREASGEYRLRVAEKLLSLDDPVMFEQLKELATQTGVETFGMNPQDFGHLTFPESKQAARQTKELSDQLDALEKAGYNLDELAQAGGSIETKTGASVPIGTALNLTRRRPVSPTGQPIAQPKKPLPLEKPSDYEQSFGRWLKDRGKTLETATGADEAAYKKEGKTLTADPDLADMNKTLKQLQIDSAQRRLDAPLPGAGGPTAAQEFGMSERLARAWTDATKATREVDRQLGLMTTGLTRFRQGDKNGGSQAVLVTFQKILDPTSVVRESEYARTTEGQSLLNRLEGYTTRLAQGGTTLTDREMAGMVDTAKQFSASMKAHTQGQRRRIEAQTKKYQLDPATVFDDVLLGGTPESTSAPSTGQKIRARDPQGTLHEAAPGTPLPAGWTVEP